MAGVGQTGYWRTGVWVEPLDAEGEFALSASADLGFTGRFAFGSPFILEGTADLTFNGAVVEFGDFALSSAAELTFTGDFIPRPGQGIFGLDATADIIFAWVPRVSGPASSVNIEDMPTSVVIKLKPGDAVIVGGVAGIVVRDDTGRLVVKNQAGQVMCIIGPSGIELI